LTSGQASNALEGSHTLFSLHENAAGRIEILPGSGIQPANVHEILKRTGCDQIHASLGGERIDTSTLANPSVRFGGETLPPEDRYGATDPDAVAAMRQLLDSR
jgi:copper homeostasis protein